MRSIAIAGHICVDIRPGLESTSRLEPGKLMQVGPVAMTLGGSVGNTGGDLTALGAPVSLFTAAGDDELGKLVQFQLAGDGLARSHVAVMPGESTSYSLILEPAGVDRTIWHHIGVNAAFDAAGLDLEGIDLFHLGYPPLLPALLRNTGAPLRRLLKGAREAGVTTSIDLAVVDPASETAALDWEAILAGMMSETDVVSPSLDDLTSALGIADPYSPGLVRHLADTLLGWGAGVVALSSGEHGLYVKTASRERLSKAGRALGPCAEAWADQEFSVPPLWVETPVTTNGAGDASTAGLLYAIAAGAGAAEAAALAAACSAALVSGAKTTPAAVSALRPDLAGLFSLGTAAARTRAPLEEETTWIP